MSFQERAKLGMKQLSNQPPVSLAISRHKAQNLKTGP